MSGGGGSGGEAEKGNLPSSYIAVVFNLLIGECPLFGHLENIAQKAVYGLDGYLQAECFIKPLMYTKF